MKRTLSTKFKLTLWFTGFLAVLAAVCLGLILVINSHVARTEAFNILSLTVRGNIPNVSANQDRLVLKPEFEFYSNNVYMLIYNKNKALISGQAPPSFPGANARSRFFFRSLLSSERAPPPLPANDP